MSNFDRDKWLQWAKRNWVWLAGAAAVAGYMTLSGTDDDYQGATLDNPYGVTYNDMLERAKHRDIQGVAVIDQTVLGADNRGRYYVSSIPSGRKVEADFSALNTKVTPLPGLSAAAKNSGGGSGSAFGSFLGIAILATMIGGIVMMMRQQGANGARPNMGAGSFKGRKYMPGDIKVRFDDVAGIDEAKQELREVVDFLRSPGKYTRLGGKMPSGLLMVGPPGTGKTLTAKAIAGEAGVPFLQTSGSEFVEMYVGVGAKRVRELFETAKSSAPCIVFIDEIDAVGKARGGGGLSGSNDEREQTLNQILVEMDGFAKNSGIVVVAATNRADVLDAALKRPGRFDRQVHIGLPDIRGREAILRVHSSKILAGPDVDLAIVAQGTPGFSGADLANLCNEAALMAAREDKAFVTMVDFENAKDKIMMGPEKKSFVMSPQDKEMTAYHEAGHAVIGAYYHRQKLHDIPHKATIVPRGGALGLVLSLPEKDQTTIKKIELESRMVMAMGGRAAERIVYGEDFVSTGAGGDIQQASKIARAMVKNYGMSELGSVDFSENSGSLQPSLSQDMHDKIEATVQKMVKDAEYKAYGLLTGELNPQWELMTQSLLKLETLNRQQIQMVMDMRDPAQIAPLAGVFDIEAAGNDNDAPMPAQEAAQDAVVIGPEQYDRSGVPHIGRGNARADDYHVSEDDGSDAPPDVPRNDL